MASVSIDTVKSKAGRTPRTSLSLKQRIEVIEEAKNNPGTSARNLAKKFSCGKTQISAILKNKDAIAEQYESTIARGGSAGRKRPRHSDTTPINEAVHDWYCLATARGVCPKGPELCVKAKEIADRLGVADFKASNGWLHGWKTRYNIYKISDIGSETLDSCRECLLELLRGYTPRDIWNFAETGCFWRALPESGFANKVKYCRSRKAKHRITVGFLVNAEGEKEEPIVIWKSPKPRCFRHVQVTQLPVQYFNQDNSCMTGEICSAVLTKLNWQLSVKGRSIALLMDDAHRHPDALKNKYSHIKIVFLPPNTASQLQPLDQGVIQNFKTHYRNLLVRLILAKMDETNMSAMEIAKAVNILSAVHLVSEAWSRVKPETIVKCFQKCGFLQKDDAEIHPDEECDPIDLEAHQELSVLISQLDLDEGTCSVDDYVNGDAALPCGEDFGGENWDDEFMKSLAYEDMEVDKETYNHMDSDFDPTPAKIAKFQEEIALEDVHKFLDMKR